MNFLAFNLFKRGRYPLATVAGGLLAIAFPSTGISGTAWIAPGLILLAALGTPGSDSFRIGFLAGLVYYLISLHWLLLIPVKVFPILGWLLLSAMMGLYVAVWAWLCVRISNFRFQVSDANVSRSPWFAAVEQVAGWNWIRRLFWSLMCAVIWVGLEWVRARFLGGFPWNPLGATQQDLLPLIQVASVTGVYGVSFLLVWSSASVLCACAVLLHRPQRRSAWLGEITLPLLAVFALFVYGLHRLRQAPVPGRELNVTLVQPSIPQTLIWDPAQNEKRFQELLRLTEAALSNQTDLLLWPESAIPKMLRYDLATYQAVTNLAVRHRIWMIVGADDAERVAGVGQGSEPDYFNCSFLISPEGWLMERYCKQSLVIFGEYVPLQRWLPFLKWFTPIQGGFTPGTKPVTFNLPDLGVQTSVLICFEDIFPALARAGAGEEIDFLVNLTNDGWFGKSSAQRQHAAAAMFRALENGLPLLRCTNTGLTCWIDAYGRQAHFVDPQGTIYGAGFMTAQIPLPPAGENRPSTFYSRHGDWLAQGCAAISALALIVSMIRVRWIDKSVLDMD